MSCGNNELSGESRSFHRLEEKLWKNALGASFHVPKQPAWTLTALVVDPGFLLLLLFLLLPHLLLPN
jgi:hypothetical protein